MSILLIFCFQFNCPWMQTMIKFITCSWLRKTRSGIVSSIFIQMQLFLSDFYASKDSILQSWKWPSISKLASLHCVKLSVFEIFLYSKFSYVHFSWQLLSLKMTRITNTFYMMRGNQCISLFLENQLWTQSLIS